MQCAKRAVLAECGVRVQSLSLFVVPCNVAVSTILFYLTEASVPLTTSERFITEVLAAPDYASASPHWLFLRPPLNRTAGL